MYRHIVTRRISRCRKWLMRFLPEYSCVNGKAFCEMRLRFAFVVSACSVCLCARDISLVWIRFAEFSTRNDTMSLPSTSSWSYFVLSNVPFQGKIHNLWAYHIESIENWIFYMENMFAWIDNAIDSFCVRCHQRLHLFIRSSLDSIFKCRLSWLVCSLEMLIERCHLHRWENRAEVEPFKPYWCDDR